MTSPVTSVLLEIPKAFQDEIITPSGLKLFYDGSYRKEWSAAVIGVISKLPTNPKPEYQKIVEQLKEGDEVCFSYQVIYDLQYGSDGERFIQATEDNDYFKEFYNGKGHSVRIQAMPKRAGIKGIVWAGVYLNKRKELIDGVQGDEATLERWLSQFSFGSTDDYLFNNFFEFEGKDYWRCNLDDIFAVRRKGHLVAIGDRIICKPVDDVLPDQYFIDGTGLPQKVVIRRHDRGRVISGGKAKNIKKDEIISFNPAHKESYTFWGKQYFLIKEKVVLGKWSKN